MKEKWTLQIVEPGNAIIRHSNARWRSRPNCRSSVLRRRPITWQRSSYASGISTPPRVGGCSCGRGGPSHHAAKAWMRRVCRQLAEASLPNVGQTGSCRGAQGGQSGTVRAGWWWQIGGTHGEEMEQGCRRLDRHSQSSVIAWQLRRGNFVRGSSAVCRNGRFKMHVESQ